jgi:hypothetical protein
MVFAGLCGWPLATLPVNEPIPTNSTACIKHPGNSTCDVQKTTTSSDLEEIIETQTIIIVVV